MKYLFLIILSIFLISCSSEQIDESGNISSEPKIIEPEFNLALTYSDIKESSSSPTISSKKGTTVVVDGVAVDVGTLGGTNTFIKHGYNGFVVGGSQIKMDKKNMESDEISNIAVHAFCHSKSKIKDLGTLGGEYSESSCVNNLGCVVGGSQKPDKSYQAFRYLNTLRALPNLDGSNHSWAYSVNDSFLIVGTAKDAKGSLRAVLWQDKKIIDLNSYLPANSGWILTLAKSITNDGEVSGVGLFNGKKSFFNLKLNLTK